MTCHVAMTDANGTMAATSATVTMADGAALIVIAYPDKGAAAHAADLQRDEN